MVKRVVLDTSTLVSAALRVDSVPSLALLKVLRECELCTSELTLQELASVLSRPKFDRYLARAERDQFVRLIGAYSVVWEVRDEVRDCRDPQVDKFLLIIVAWPNGEFTRQVIEIPDYRKTRAITVKLP